MKKGGELPGWGRAWDSSFFGIFLGSAALTTP